MSLTFTFFAPAGVAPQISCRSGNTYSADASGIVKSVVTADILDMSQAGCIALGQLTGKDNWAATTNPGSTNDNTQDYVIGSKWFNSSTGVLYVAQSVGTGTASWAAQSGSGYAGLPWVTGQFYASPGGVTLESLLTVLGTMYAYPVFVPNGVTLGSLNISSITGQTGGKMRCALYRDTGAGYPGALVAGTDSGDLAATATAVATKGSLAVALTPGWYWVGSQATASSTMPSVAAIKTLYTNEMAKLLGFDTAAHALATSAEAPTGVAVTGQTYGAMPSTFPASATITLNADTPVVALGV